MCIAGAGWSQEAEMLTRLEREIVQLVKRSQTSVVSIYARVTKEFIVDETGGLWGFLTPKKETRRAVQLKHAGTGLILDGDGYVVTKTSVVEGADEIKVSLADGRVYLAEYVGADYNTGLALLKIEADNLQMAELGSSQSMFPGTWALVIGNSYGVLAPSLGTVNGMRSDGLLQLSAQVAGGNTGSPVFNMRGEVIGIVAASIDISGSDIGSFFGSPLSGTCLAYPIGVVREVADEIIELENSGSGWLGFNANHYTPTGTTVITEINENGPAARAGLAVGDILVSLAGHEMKQYDEKELVRLVRSTTPGEEIAIAVTRNGEAHQFTVSVAERPSTVPSSKPIQPLRMPQIPGEISFPDWSLVEQMDAQFRIQIRELVSRIRQLESEVQELKR